MNDLLHPQEITIKSQREGDKKYIISAFPWSAGREIMTQYPITAIPKIGDYQSNAAVVAKMMCYVAVPQDSGPLRLTTQGLCDNHIPDWECGARLEKEMIKYNASFFQNGEALNFFEAIAKRAPVLITKILTPLLEQLLAKAGPRSTS